MARDMNMTRTAAGEYFIWLRGKRIGRVTHFAGNPPARRWIAYAREPAMPEHGAHKAGFRTLKAAREWLQSEWETAETKH